VSEGRPIRVALAFVAFFASWLSLSLAAIVAVARSGLGTPTQALLAGPLVLGAAAFSPFLLPRGARARLESQPAWAGCAVLAMWLSPILALQTGWALAPVYPLALLAGLLRALPALRRLSLAELALLVLGPPVLALYVFSQVHVSPFAHVLVPEQALMGTLGVDTGLHISLSHLIYSSGVPSIGMDGVVPMQYHVGSHAWFAGLATLGGVRPYFAYPLGQVCVAVPMLYAALYWATVCVARSSRDVALQILSATLLVWIFDRIGWTSYYISESFTFGLAALLLTLPLLLDLVERPRRGARGDLVRLAVLLAAVPILASMKLSVGYAFCVAMGYTVLRVYRVSWWSAATLPLLAALGLLSLHFFQARTGQGIAEMISPLHFYRETTMGVFFDARKAHSSLVLPLVYVLLSLWQRGRDNASADGRSWGLSTELLAVTTLAVHLPGLVLAMWNATAWWFQNVAQWIAIPMLIARFAPRPAGQMSALAQALALVLGLAVLASGPILRIPHRFVAIAARVEASAARQAGDPPPARGPRLLAKLQDSLARREPLFDAGIRESLDANPLAAAARWISEQAKASGPHPVAVFVPPHNRAFWSPHGETPIAGACLQRPFVLPAATGVPMLMGLPPGCPNFPYSKGYGHGDYGPEARARALPDRELCRHALERRIATVLVLESLEESSANRRLDCLSIPERR